MLGLRNVRFSTRTGVDAVNAAEDVRKGIEVRAVVGHTLGAGKGLQEDRFVVGSLYAGAEIGSRMLAFLRGRAEARRVRRLRLYELGGAPAATSCCCSRRSSRSASR